MLSNLKYNYQYSISVGGVLGIAFLSAELDDRLKDELIPEGTTPIAAILTNSTLPPNATFPRINATSATFAETAGDSGS